MEAAVAGSCYHAQPLPAFRIDRARIPAIRHNIAPATLGRTPGSSWATQPITYLTGGLSAPYAARMY